MAKVELTETFTVTMKTTYDIPQDYAAEFCAKLHDESTKQARRDNIADCLRRVADDIHIDEYKMEYEPDYLMLLNF